ncbi:4378_t:CDS:2, partial [Funneliformis caledonium]
MVEIMENYVLELMANIDRAPYYEDLVSENGFRQVPECQNDDWMPYVMIDKHRPSKLAIQN